MTRSLHNWSQLGLVKRSDKVNTARMLLIADAAERLGADYTDEQIVELFDIPGQGGVSPATRLYEARSVHEYWPWELREAAVEVEAPWHALFEATRWDDVAQDKVLGFVRDHLRRKGRWPEVGDLRRLAGRTPNHPLPGEHADQASFEVLHDGALVLPAEPRA